MEPVGLLILAIFAPLLCGAATLLLPRQQIGLRVAIAAAGPLLALLFLFNQIAVHGFHGVYFVSWMPAFHLDLALQADHLGLFFALLVSGIGLLIVLYARAYFGPDADSLYRFYPMLNLFMTAMLGVALADSFMLLLLFWEMTSISSFLLIGWERDKPHAVQLAMQAFITTAAGGLAMMGGLIMLGIHTDAWTFSALYDARGTLQDGTAIAGVDDLRAYLLGPRREDFARTLVTKMMAYALGRSLELTDEPEVERITAEFLSEDMKLKNLAQKVVASDLFQTK